MQISFATTAYIAGTPDEILDKMSNSLSITAQTDGMVIVSKDVIEEVLTHYESTKNTADQNISNKLAEFLKDAMQEITKDKDIISDNIGEIFFVS